MSVDSALLGGRYRLEELIGRGGMASVWRATDTVLERTVAVKRLHARLHDDPELAERFRREGHAVARLSHPNLVRLLDQGQEGDEPFLVFELVEGRDLKTMIRRDGRLPVGEAASICAQVARALAAAHAAGVVHRDIKSHNVLVTPEGEAKLTDFGIARIVEAEGVNLTKTGIVMGSSDYLAPEQAEGREVDARGDVYSLGVVLFEALTGRLPFSGDNPVAVATKHVYEAAPDPRKLVPSIPADIAAVCLHALAKQPQDRYVDAAAFASALEGHGGEALGAPGDAGETGRLHAVRPRRAVPVAVGAAIVVLVGAGVAWRAGVFSGSGPGNPAARAAVLAFAGVEAYDPAGGDGEHDAEARNAADGVAATEWTTEGYKAANINGKSGVGLLIRLSRAARLTRVRVTSSTQGGAFRILGPGSTVDARAVLSGDHQLGAGPVDVAITSNAVVSEFVVWITTLPQSGTGPNPFRAAIGEVQAEGVAKT
jgi:eukaryotic-like serine/threonine-protein kinase